MKKYAVFSIDVEDWYHLDYFKNHDCDKSQRLVKEGLENFTNLIIDEKINATYFIVGELVKEYLFDFKNILKLGNEISAHSYFHNRPITQNKDEFFYESKKVKNTLKKYLNLESIGYRAPCFSIDKERFDILKVLKYKYDSSKINVSFHPLYSELKLDKKNTGFNNIYHDNGFYEFELPTIDFLGKKIPVSGGGYLRIFPWFFYKYLLKKFLLNSNTFFFFIHPFELTNKKINLPDDLSFLTKIRFNFGRKYGLKKTRMLIHHLKNEGYEFVTFKSLISKLNE